ncbi:MAG: 5-oxoprolinase subunit PxpA, partial [Pseudomonadota bacterium]
LVLYQIGALAAICRAEGTELSYVKPHGALYNDKARSEEIFTAVAKAVVAFDPKLPLMTLAIRDTSRLRQLAEAQGITLLLEAFADRGYDENGHLLSRRLPGAVHHDPDTIIEQARRIAQGEALTASDGSDLILEADALCVHGDNAESVASVRRIREMLETL